MGKIFNALLKWFLPIVLLFATVIFSNFLPRTEYINVTAFYIAINYYILIVIISSGKNRKHKESLYRWLDILDGEEDVLEILKYEKKEIGIMPNLEKVRNYFSSYYDKTKLKLLRGYFKTLNEEGPSDMLFKTLLGIIVAVIIWGINRGYVLDLMTYKGNENPLKVNSIYLTILNFATIVHEGSLVFALIIKDYFISKKRNKIIVEILDVCIEGTEKNNKRKK